jgi:para-nitrobenzyl esterase
VWFHGGAFAFGSSNQIRLRGSRLCRHDVVVVTVNQRLNIFGHLDLSEIGGPDFARSGNAGTLDMLAALEWVRDNIAALGGDPGNVTIFGQSGGGMKVGTMMAMPPAKGLFHRAIAQSGSAIRGVEREAAWQTAREVMATLGLKPNRIEELQRVPADKLVEVQRVVDKAPYAIGTHMPLYLRPVVGSKSLPMHPCDPAAPAMTANLPAIIGGTRDEASTPAARENGELDEAGLKRRVTPLAGPAKAARLIELARKEHPGMGNAALYSLLAAESFRFDGITQAERRAALQGAPSWLYLFNWPAEAGKAVHGVELPFCFDNVHLIKREANAQPEIEALAKMVSTAWVSFARSGNPNHPGMPKWEPYDANSRRTMVFEADSKMVSDPTRNDRLNLKAVGL